MNKVVLITGASSGLGRVLVEKFSSNGFVVFAGARDVSKIQTKDKNIFPIKLDITIDKDCKNVVEEIIRKRGRIWKSYFGIFGLRDFCNWKQPGSYSRGNG